MILRAVASALPDTRISNEEVAAWCDSSADFLRDKVGLEERRFLQPGETGLELSARACETLFSRHGLLPAAVDLCLLVGQVRDQTVPHGSALLQARLGLPETCACLDIGLACSGYVYGLSLARGIMQAEGLQNALLVTCDPYSRIMGRSSRDTVTLFGDAATATWLSLEGSGAEVGLTDMGTDGSKASYLWRDEPSPEKPTPELTMNGRGIFKFALDRVPGSIDRCLVRNGLTRKDIDIFLLHQANAFIVQSLAKAMDLSSERCPVTMARVGNTVSSSLPLALENILFRNPPATRMVLCGFGGGLSWASTVLTVKEPPE